MDYSAPDEAHPQKKTGWIVSLRVKFDPAWIALTPADVEACFADIGARPASYRATDGGSSWTKRIPRALEHGGKLAVGWSDFGDKTHVDELSVSLKP